MQPRFRPAPLALALAALIATPGAQALETVPLAVTEAYIGQATPNKLAAALAGLRPLITELPLITPPGPCWFCGSSGSTWTWTPGGLVISQPSSPWGSLFLQAPLEELWISSDADLAPLGDPVLLAHTRLLLGASFSTARDFVIGNPALDADHQPMSQMAGFPRLDDDPVGPPLPNRPYDGGPGFIDTQGHTFKITGVLTAHQRLYKEGEGALWLTGANVWNAAPTVLGGVLQGDAMSLDTPILVEQGAQVNFLQQGDGTYRHALTGSGQLLKTGAGVLTFTGEQHHTGGTTVAAGTLALAQGGRLPEIGRLLVGTDGILDLTALEATPILRSLEGNGRVTLGDRGLTLDLAAADTAFTGAIGGTGPLTVRGQSYTLTGANSFSGGLSVVGTTLGIGLGASLGLGEVKLDGAALRILAPLQADQTLRVEGWGTLDGNGHDFAWAGEIVGAGRLEKTSAGTLSLLKDNGFSGEFIVAEGSVKLVGAAHLDQARRVSVLGTLDLSEADAARRILRLEGSGQVLLNANGLILGDDDTHASFYGTIVGAGGLTKLGTGVQELFGFADYAGPTLILAGTLRVAPQALGQQVVNHAALDFVQGGGLDSIAAWSGDIQGSGRLVKSGDGVLWLRGRNSHTGGTWVEQGALMGNTDSLPGDIETHAGLAFYQVADGTYTGRVSGTGTLMSFGPGALTLTGDNTHSGGTAFSNTLRIGHDRNLGDPASKVLIAGGTLVALDDLALNRPVALGEAGGRFDSNGHAIHLNGRVFGPGGLTKLGQGGLHLHGEHEFTGPTQVEAGYLEVHGSLAGDVHVWSGAGFAGQGRIGGDLTIAPGASFMTAEFPGALTIGGDLIVQGRMLLEMGTYGHDLIEVGGVADLTGATLRLLLLYGTQPDHVLGRTFLSAAGGIRGLDQVTYQLDPILDGYHIATNGRELYLTSSHTNLAPVPEPGTWAMLLAGLGLVGLMARRRR